MIKDNLFYIDFIKLLLFELKFFDFIMIYSIHKLFMWLYLGFTQLILRNYSDKMLMILFAMDHCNLPPIPWIWN